MSTDSVDMKTVLVIDDEPLFRSFVVQLLSYDGWKVLEAEDGESGVQVALAHKPSHILCDLLMPRGNGLFVCRSIRKHPDLNGTRIIIVSGQDYEADREFARRAGADDYLTKPVTLGMLKEALSRQGMAEPLAVPTTPVPGGGTEEGPVRFKFWGVRGSIPAPGTETVQFGGNTSCIEVRADGEIIVLDAGSGIRPLGMALAKEYQGRALNLTLLITHTHWDHIQGFPFFVPAYIPCNSIQIIGYEGARHGLQDTLSGQMESPYFPIGMKQMPGHIKIQEMKDLEFNIGKVKVQAAFVNHPGICVGYRLTTSEGSITFIPDNEAIVRYKSQPGTVAREAKPEYLEYARQQEKKLVEFIQGTDVLIMDAQYDEPEYATHVGWGHSCLDDTVVSGLKANVKHLYLFHHDPAHNDAKIQSMLDHARKIVAASGGTMLVDAAREGSETMLASVKAASPTATPAKGGQ